MTDQTFIVVQDCWRWALRDQDGDVLAHSDRAFETREMALEDLASKRAGFPDAGVQVRERCE